MKNIDIEFKTIAEVLDSDYNIEDYKNIYNKMSDEKSKTVKTVEIDQLAYYLIKKYIEKCTEYCEL